MSQPVLVYTRIDANRRKSRLLVAAAGVLVVPVVSGLLEASPLVIAMVMMIGGLVAMFFTLHPSRVLLRAAGACRVAPDSEPYLIRVVEKLCIGAGLPVPSIHVVESGAPNAFAIGRDPQHASLVVTRGLLTLLDQRELEGVIAHELSHIGNHDIRLTTTLAALVTTLSVPFQIVAAPFDFLFDFVSDLLLDLPWALVLALAIPALFVAFPLLMLLLLMLVSPIFLAPFADAEESVGLLPFLWWPLYILVGAPILALLLRQAVSREREFLADADAVLLTRDPEGLALALVKVAAARGERLQVGEGSVHLYFADPLADGGSFMHRIFPSHPPVEQRIELLARMGSGIRPVDLRRALKAGASAQQPASHMASPMIEIAAHTGLPLHTPVAVASLTPLYEQPDGWSRVLRQLPPDAVVIPVGKEGNFMRVITNDRVAGYVSSLAPLRVVKEVTEKGVTFDGAESHGPNLA